VGPARRALRRRGHDPRDGDRHAARWGDGGTDPLLTDLERPDPQPRRRRPVDPRPARRPSSNGRSTATRPRFDTASDMRQAFDRLFAEVDVPATSATDGLSRRRRPGEAHRRCDTRRDRALPTHRQRARTARDGHRRRTSPGPPHELSRLSGCRGRRPPRGRAPRRCGSAGSKTSRWQTTADVPSVDRLAELLVPKRTGR
jgi:hypothetical protein